jgi:hypothetical protein
MMVLLVPDASYPAQMTESFLGIHEILNELEVPFVPLIETFSQVPDLAPYRVADNDRHPNAEGHRALHARLIAQLEAKPHLMRVVAGQ